MIEPLPDPVTQLQAGPRGQFILQKLQSLAWFRWVQSRCGGVLPQVLTGVIATGLVVVLRSLGSLQSLELSSYDAWVRLQPDRGSDPRLLIVGITEEDLQRFGWPISDQLLSKAIANLERHQPRVLGLDIFRDIPIEPGHQQLLKTLRSSDRLINVCKVGDGSHRGVAPPPGIDLTSTGFVDFVVDPDGVIRRNLLYLTPPPGSCQSFHSFSFLLALRYLAAQGILPEYSQESTPKLGDTIFRPLQSSDGGYSKIDAQGYQVLLQYRTSGRIAQTISLADVLGEQVHPNWIRDRIVLIGYIAPSLKDTFYTPFTSGQIDRQPTSGVVLHAQMLSQILSAVLNDHPLVWTWPKEVEAIWIWGWAVIGSACMGFFRHPLGWLLGSGLTLVALTGICWIGFSFAGWLPWVPAILVVGLTNISLIAYRAYQAQFQERQLVQQVQAQNQAIQILQGLLIQEPHPDRVSVHESEIQDRVNTILGGRYHIQHLLGQGGFARTFIATDTQRPGHPLCVVKCLRVISQRPEIVRASRRLFQIEAEILERLGQHDRIPHLLAYFEEQQTFYLVEEYVAGYPLTVELLHPCPESSVITILQETLEVLAFVHQHQIIHRDIKPSNLIRRQRDQRLVLIDFGAVKQMQPSGSQSGSLALQIGTPGYAAPEQLAGRPVLSSDLYAVGIVGIQSLTGFPPKRIPRHPISGSVDWQRLQLPCSPVLSTFLQRLTQLVPSDRYPSATDALHELEVLLNYPFSR